MNIIEIIEKKKDNKKLSELEINYVIDSYVKEMISDAQMSALLMAICINGLDEEETFYLTKAMINSGDTIDLSSITGIKVDKHSTGGVGDKTTLIVAPIVAACGVPVAKLSGRGLGHTGGTIDKLESIDGFCSALSSDDFIKQVKDIGIVDAEQTKKIVPADKKIYALRDVTGTTKSIPLIASSIMSKKIASGADKIVLDVKTGSGALITEFQESVKLAKLMVFIGKKYGKQTVAFVTDMNEPLGNAIGNGLEVKEAIKVLNAEGDKRLTEFCLSLASSMISLGKEIPLEEAKKLSEKALYSKEALAKFKEFVKYQGGDVNKIAISQNKFNVYSSYEGYVHDIDEVKLALECLKMGAGRKNKGDKIKPGVGIVKFKSVGDYVQKGDVLVTVYYEDIKADIKTVENAFVLSSKEQKENPILYTIIE